jgi:hypothetical protein
LATYEVALTKFVLDQPIGSRGIGDAQQRFREHHDRYPLPGRERELMQHVLDASKPAPAGTNGLDQPLGNGVDAPLTAGDEPRRPQQVVRKRFIVLGVWRGEVENRR